MTDLTIGSESFNVLIEGDDTLPVVMLSNSLGSDLHLWDAQMPALLKQFRVVRYDSRGHGGSVANEGPYSIDDLGRDALTILDALGIDKAHFIGLSMGGAIGQWLLINAPDRIERAVLSNTAAQFGQASGWNNRIIAVHLDGMDAIVDATMQRWFSAAFAADQPGLVEPIRKTFLKTPALGYAACCAALRDLDLREGLLRITQPVLVITGRDDPVFTPEQSDVLANSIMGAKRITLATQHISNIEDAAGFTTAIIDFLTAKASARRKTTTMPLPVARRPTARRPAASRIGTTDLRARRPASKPPATKPKAESAAIASKAAPKAKTPSGNKTPPGKKTSPAKKSAAAATVPASRKATSVASARKSASTPAPVAKSVAKKSASPSAPAKKAQAKGTVGKPTARGVKAPAKKTPAKILATRAPAAAKPAKPGKAKSAPAARAKAPAKVMVAAKALAATKAKSTRPAKAALKPSMKKPAGKTPARTVLSSKTKTPPIKPRAVATPAPKASRKVTTKTAGRRKA